MAFGAQDQAAQPGVQLLDRDRLLLDEQLATKRDLKELEMALRREIEDVRRDMKEMEMRIIIKLGAMMAASIAVVATLVKLI